VDWTKQSEEMFKSWSENQQKMWDTWLKAMQQGASVPAQAASMWQKTVETWEGVVTNILEAQTEWARLWVNNLTSTGMPQEVVDWARQSQEMSQRWTEAQQQLWQSWFELVRKIDPGKMPADWEQESQKIFNTWKDSTQKIMETQAEWTRRWSNYVQDEAQARADSQKV
jgi:hypothetical protein